MNSLVFGASAGIGRALCRELARRGHNLTLISRNEADLRAESAHCALLYGVEVDWLALDAIEVGAMSAMLSRHMLTSAKRYDHLFFPVGGAQDHDAFTMSAAGLIETVNSNLSAVMLAVHVLLPYMNTGSGQSIVGFSSIAALRGRRLNVVYAAAKRGLESYFESLRHECAQRGIRVQLYRLGYVKTQQSFGKELPFRAVSPEGIASSVCANLDSDFGVRYLPRLWKFASVLRFVPWPIFRRLNF